MFNRVWSILKQANTLAKQERLTKADLKEKALIAKHFNNRYTYRMRLFEDRGDLDGFDVWGGHTRGGYAWMCPTCNKIHEPTAITGLTGLQYPKCCGYSAGHRLDEKIRIK